MKRRQAPRAIAGGILAVITLATVGCTSAYSGPWNLEDLREVPEVHWAESSGPVRSLYYTGGSYRGRPTRVFAYYAVPDDSGRLSPNGKVPGMVLVHGGGGTAFREWAELWAGRGYAAIAMDLAGRGTDGERLPDGGPDQDERSKFHAIRDGPVGAWPYHAVSNVIRAHSLLRSLPEVDPDRTGVTGISWGGYLTCVAAGLDHRFKVAVPVYGCGFLHENSAWLGILDELATEDRQRWIVNFDPSRYLSQCRLPMLFVNGTNDFAYPLDSWQKSYRLVRGPVTLCLTVGMPHSHPDGWAPKEIGIFVDSVLRRGVPLPRPTRFARRERTIVAEFTSRSAVAKAALYYTADRNAWNQREWHTEPAQVQGRRVLAELPAVDVAAWFLNITDERDAVVSTPHEGMAVRRICVEARSDHTP